MLRLDGEFAHPGVYTVEPGETWRNWSRGSAA